MPLKRSLVPDRDTIRGRNHPLSFDTRVGAIARDPASSFGWLALRGHNRLVTFDALLHTKRTLKPFDGLAAILTQWRVS